MDRHTASEYIKDNFEPTDRLAVMLLDKRSGAVTQRLVTAERAASPEFQAWLRHKNAQKHEVYVSMNALHSGASGRTKADVAAVRHVYLDFDRDGTAAVERLLARQDLPKPNYQVNTSPDKWQIVWKVEGFTTEAAERLQRGLARDAGADPAATDSTRVLRLPGFYNQKYEKPHFVTVEKLSDHVYTPEDFPAPERLELASTSHSHSLQRAPKDGLSQSERDWAFAKRALARGESQDNVVMAIAILRRYEKHDPQYYAERTVQRAAQSLEAERPRAPDQGLLR